MHVLVTGCDSGFGWALVHKLLAQKVSVIACYHSVKSRDAMHVSDLLTKLVIDVTDDASIAKMSREVTSLLQSVSGKLEAVVHNAGGLLVAGPAEWSPIDQDKAQMDLNFFGAVRVVNALLPHIRHSQGRIILVSSVLGRVASPLGAMYSASKFALEGWADALRREMLAFGVTVHLIEPGMFVSTRFYQNYGKQVATNWHSVSEQVRTDYGSAYKEYCVKRLIRLKEFFGASNIDPVIDCMVHAIQSSWPRHRYPVGIDSTVFARIIAWLPYSAGDLAMTLADALVMRDRGMIPVAPAMSKHSLIIAHTALFRYNQSWLLVVSVIVFLAVCIST